MSNKRRPLHGLARAAKRSIELQQQGLSAEEALAQAANEHLLPADERREAGEIEAELSGIEAMLGIPPVPPGPFVAEMFTTANLARCSNPIPGRWGDRVSAIRIALSARQEGAGG